MIRALGSDAEPRPAWPPRHARPRRSPFRDRDDREPAAGSVRRNRDHRVDDRQRLLGGALAPGGGGARGVGVPGGADGSVRPARGDRRPAAARRHRGVDAVGARGAVLHALHHRGRPESGACRSPEARRCTASWAPPTATPGTSPIPTGSIPTARTRATTSPSAPAATSASARRSHESRRSRRCCRCSAGCRGSGWTRQGRRVRTATSSGRPRRCGCSGTPPHRRSPSSWTGVGPQQAIAKPGSPRPAPPRRLARSRAPVNLAPAGHALVRPAGGRNPRPPAHIRTRPFRPGTQDAGSRHTPWTLHLARGDDHRPGRRPRLLHPAHRVGHVALGERGQSALRDVDERRGAGRRAHGAARARCSSVLAHLRLDSRPGRGRWTGSLRWAVRCSTVSRSTKSDGSRCSRTRREV